MPRFSVGVLVGPQFTRRPKKYTIDELPEENILNFKENRDEEEEDVLYDRIHYMEVEYHQQIEKNAELLYKMSEDEAREFLTELSIQVRQKHEYRTYNQWWIEGFNTSEDEDLDEDDIHQETIDIKNDHENWCLNGYEDLYDPKDEFSRKRPRFDDEIEDSSEDSDDSESIAPPSLWTEIYQVNIFDPTNDEFIWLDNVDDGYKRGYERGSAPYEFGDFIKGQEEHGEGEISHVIVSRGKRIVVQFRYWEVLFWLNVPFSVSHIITTEWLGQYIDQYHELFPDDKSIRVNFHFDLNRMYDAAYSLLFDRFSKELIEMRKKNHSLFIVSYKGDRLDNSDRFFSSKGLLWVLADRWSLTPVRLGRNLDYLPTDKVFDLLSTEENVEKIPRLEFSVMREYTIFQDEFEMKKRQEKRLVDKIACYALDEYLPQEVIDIISGFIL